MSTATTTAFGAPGDHLVQFYVHDRELVDGVAEYLAGAIRAGGAALLAATSAHRAAVEERMAAGGLDVEDARARGVLVSVDARDTMGRFLVGGRPDPDLFRDVAGSLVRAGLAVGGPVNVYGEMVDLLCDDGRVDSAIELEGLWTALASELPFSLYCSYRSEAVSADQHVDAFREICRLHSAVVAAPSGARPADDLPAGLSRTFPADPEAPGHARRFVVAALRSWADEELVGDAALVVTELATNAILHARSAFTVTLTSRSGTVEIAVEDASPLEPVGQVAAEASLSGRGLAIIAALARRWGTASTAAGKRVWAELPG